MSLIGMAQNAYHAVCLATAIGCGVVASGAVTLDLKAPGELAEALSAVPSNTDELVLTGHVDASELIMLRDSLPGLLRLDMGRLEIVPATIHPYAFAAMPLTSVVLPDDVAVIGEAAFAALPITEIGLPQSLDSIAPYAFAHSLLSGVEIPENTAVIGRNAFGDCRNLAWLSGGAGLKKVGEYAFHGSALSEVNLSDAARLRYVGAGAFEDCGELYAVTLPSEGNYTLGEGVFMGCGNLHNITASVAAIPALALADAPDADLSEIVRDGVSTIGAYALSGNQANEITLPSTLDSIGPHGMERMPALMKINARSLESVPVLGEDVWDGVYQPMVTLSAATGMADGFKAADQWREFNITDNATSGLSGVMPDGGGIVLRFDGTMLNIAAPEPIAMVEVVTVDGIVLANTNPDCAETVLDASGWPGNICIVMVRLAFGSVASYTLSR